MTISLRRLTAPYYSTTLFVDSNPKPLMSALGQKQTSVDAKAMSALPTKADVGQRNCDVRFVPKADILRCGKECRYSITSSARASRVGGTSSPSAFAVFRLITSSYLVGKLTGRSDGLAPLRILSM